MPEAKAAENRGSAQGAAEWLRGVPEAREFTSGVALDGGAPGGEALDFHAHQKEQFAQPLATGCKFGEQQFADVSAFDATGVGATRLAQRFSRRQVRSCFRHDEPLPK